MQILVVDDEPGVRQVAARILAEAGFDIIEASDGLQALEIVRERAATLDLVVSDIVMPRLGGIELLEQLSLTYPELPVVLLSGFGPVHPGAGGRAIPCTVLSKPLIAARLIEEVRRCLALRA